MQHVRVSEFKLVPRSGCTIPYNIDGDVFDAKAIHVKVNEFEGKIFHPPSPSCCLLVLSTHSQVLPRLLTVFGLPRDHRDMNRRAANGALGDTETIQARLSTAVEEPAGKHRVRRRQSQGSMLRRAEREINRTWYSGTAKYTEV